VVGDVADGDHEDGGEAGGEEEVGQLSPEEEADPHHLHPVHLGQAHPVGGDGVLRHLHRAQVLQLFRDESEKTYTIIITLKI
jgi:hypothetical protein